MNWDDARMFLAICRETTLRGAARALSVDQATVGRRLASLERDLGTTLFLRTSDGYVLTGSGEAALSAVEKMERSALEMQRQIQGLDERLTGLVRVTSTDALAIDFLIPAFARLHEVHSDVKVQFDASSHLLNLAKREADIAIRNQKPENPDLIARRIARWQVGLFASPGYLEKRGAPEPGTAFAGHDVVAYHPYTLGVKEISVASEPITRGRLVSTVSSALLLRRAIAAGLGVGELPLRQAAEENLVRLWPDVVRPHPYEVWLVTHADLRHTARVRAVIDSIVDEFARFSD